MVLFVLFDREPAPSATIESEAPKGWLDILGYDGGLPLLLYSGYLHSFDFTIKGGEVVRIGFLEALAPLAGGSSMMRLPKWIFRFTSFSIAKALFTRWWLGCMIAMERAMKFPFITQM